MSRGTTRKGGKHRTGTTMPDALLPSHIIRPDEMPRYEHVAPLAAAMGARVQTVAAALARLRIGPAFDRTGRRVVARSDFGAIAAEVRRRA